MLWKVQGDQAWSEVHGKIIDSEGNPSESGLEFLPANSGVAPEAAFNDKYYLLVSNDYVGRYGENWGIFEDIYCAGNDSVFTFLENVLSAFP